ncbi:MAG: hypothetical protein ACOYMA_06450 [Bacteroidia bacterium]
MILSSFITLLFSSCLGSDYGPCEGAGSTCTGKVLGTLAIDSNIYKNLPSEFLGVIDFENSNGFKTTFSLSSNQKNYNIRYDLLYRSEPSECATKYCYDFILAKRQETVYNSNNTSFNFVYSLTSISTTKAPTFLKDSMITGYTVSSIKVNQDEFKLPFNRSDFYNWRLLDTIQINNKPYFSVYHVYLDSSLINKTYIKPQGIYYKKDIGLIAFYLTNGETWGMK